MPLNDFLDKPFERDLLTKIIIKKDERAAAYQSLRNSSSDYPILNAAAACVGNTWTIAVGARPNAAAIARRASDLLSNSSVTTETAEEAAALAAAELSFGANMRGSADYRRAMCHVLVKRAVMEVLTCR